MSTMTAQELADKLGGTLDHCPPDRPLSEVNGLEEAGPEAVSFLANPKYASKAMGTRAGLILASPAAELGELPVLRMANPYHGFAQALALLHPEPEPEFSPTPIHPTAVTGEGCRISPLSTVGARTVLGARCIVHPGVHIAEDCILGDDCELFPGVVLYRRSRLGDRVRIHSNTVLGSDGFGYVLVEGRHLKIPQTGWIEVEDDVEVGACTTLDRGAFGPTRLGRGTKVDNQCQLAHGTKTGAHCIICAQTGLAGSTTMGDYVTLAGRAGSTGHLHIGSKAILSACGVAAKDVPEGTMVSGYPARPHKEWLQSMARLAGPRKR